MGAEKRSGASAKLLVTDEAPACVEVKAPAALKCDRTVWLCPISSGFGSCTGWGQQRWGAVFVASAAAPSAKAASLAAADETDETLMLSFWEGEETTDECSGYWGFQWSGHTAPQSENDSKQSCNESKTPKRVAARSG